MPTLHWKYRAYDENEAVNDGVCTGDNHIDVIFSLRQEGLQVIVLDRITKEQYAAEHQVEKMRARVNIRETPHREYQKRKFSIRWWWSCVVLLFLILSGYIVFALMR